MAKNEALKRTIDNIKLSHNIRQSDIAMKVGVKNTYLSDVINGRVPLSDNLAEKFYEQFHIDKLNLRTGEGEMLKDNDTTVVNYEHKGVPYYDVDFIAGFDVVLNNQTVNPEYYINYKPYNNATCWVNVTGHSMEPSICQGDVVALKQVESWRDFLLLGEVYAIITEDFRTIKIISQSEDPDCYRLVPINKATEYGEQDIPKRLIRDIFKVLGVAKKF